MDQVEDPRDRLAAWQRRAYDAAVVAWREWQAQRDAEPSPADALLDVAGPGTIATRWVRSGEEVGADELDRWGHPLPRSVRRPGVPGTCGVLITRGELAGTRCPRVAGQGTVHKGVGQCVAHGGAKRHGRAVGAWLMAHAFGAELDISPWEALLRAVRIAAGKVAYIEWVLSTAKSDLELEGRVRRSGEGDNQILVHPDTGEPLGVGAFRDLSFWVSKSELWHDRLARTAKMAIDAGVARWQVERAQQEADGLARVLNAVIEGMAGEITDEQVTRMRSLMRSELLQIDQERDKTALTASTDPDVAVVDSTYRENV